MDLPFIYEQTLKMLKMWVPTVLLAWIPVYEILIDEMDFEENYKADAFDLIKALSDITQPLKARCGAVHILSHLCRKVETNEFEKQLVPRVSNMSKDYNWEVRKAMVESLPSILDLLEGKPSLFDKYFL